jgi:hypothetical protein
MARTRTWDTSVDPTGGEYSMKQGSKSRTIGTDPRTAAGFGAKSQGGVKKASMSPAANKGRAGNQMQLQGTKSGKGSGSKGIKAAAYGVKLGSVSKGVQKSAAYKGNAGQGVNIAGRGGSRGC